MPVLKNTITLSVVNDGAKGDTGKGIQSTTRYYCLEVSSEAPSKPTTNPPGSKWTTTEPSYTTGNTSYLYITDLTVYTDSTFLYSDVSLSSSYEAAKAAYAKAVNAETEIEKTNEAVALRATKNEVTETLKDYATTAAMNSAIEVKADEITSTVEANYSTTAEMNSAIEQKANEITSSVNETLSDYSTTTQMNSAIEQKANAITSTVNETLSDYSTTSEMNSAIEQKATEISSSVSATYATKTEVTSAVDGIQVGGTNLFTGTRDFSGDAWINSDLWSVDAEYKGFSVRVKDSAFGGLTQEITVTAGEKYVFSCYAKQYSGGETRFYCVVPGATSITDKDRFVVTAVNWSWRRIEIAFTVTADGVIRPRLESTVADKRLYVCGIKLEKGTKATDWSPAPEDAENRISTAETQIAQNAEDIVLRATKTEVEGGRNYLPALSKATGAISPYVTCQYDVDNGTYILTATGGAGSFPQIYKSGIACRALAGKKCLFHAEAISRSREDLDPRVYVNFFDSDGTSLSSHRLDAGVLSTTMNVSANATTMQYIIRLDQNKAQVAGDIAGFKGLKLEVGTTATDWTPALEDPARGVKTSSITVDADSIDIDTGGSLNLNGADVTLSSGSTMAIESGGSLNLNGADVVLNADASMTIQSGGTFQLTAPEENESYIRFGDADTPNFSASASGDVVAQTLRIAGMWPLLAAMAGLKVSVAQTAPSGSNILWIKPSTTSRKDYTYQQSGSDVYIVGEGQQVTLAQADTSTLSGSTFTYTVTLPISEYAGKTHSNVQIYTYLINGSTTVDMGYKQITLYAWVNTTLTYTVTSSVNLASAAGNITLKINTKKDGGNYTTSGIRVQRGGNISASIVSDQGSTSGAQSCQVYYIP